VELRHYEVDDEPRLIALWHETKVHAYPYLPTEQAYTVETDTHFFREHVAPRCEIWLAVDGDGDALQGFLALEKSYIDRLYVRPDQQRRGVGKLLLEKAKQLSPKGLELHTHQQNISACSFYERHGFRAARYGTSAPPESAPDVEYHWRPQATER
jgi:ribosomal protein S18 acetylase RimI-like enzyme